MPNLEDIEKEIATKEEENQFLKSKSMGLQDAVDSNFMPKSDSNIIEYKLSAEELLSRIEHYLRGDILKTKINESGQSESFYTTPTKIVTTLVIQEKVSKIVYYIHEKQEENDIYQWVVVSIKSPDEDEEITGEEHGTIIGNELKDKFNNKSFSKLGYTKREVVDNSKINLNDYGVSEIMNILSNYVTKETFLSNYKELRINEIMADIGDELNKFLYVNGKAMGLDTEYKKTKYPLMVITVLHAIESAYRRSIGGIENRGTREGIIITQHQPSGNPMPTMAPKKKWNPFDKSTW